MDRAIVERAVKALAAIGAAQEPDTHIKAEPAAVPAAPECEAEGLARCGSPGCAGCYDLGDGRRIHPPKCGQGWTQ
jgi:hypothetical protein